MTGNQLISIFVPSLRGGGAERVMLNLAHGLTKQNIAVDLVLAKAEGPLLAQVPPDVRVIDLGKGRVLASLPRLVGYLRKEQPIALLSAMNHANITALWAKWLAGVPTRVVVSVHNTLSRASKSARNRKARLMPYLVKRFYPWADEIVAVSHGVADDLANITGFPINRFRVIFNPVVTPELLDLSQKPLGHPWFAPGAPRVILSVGRLTAQKDYPTLIRAFSKVRRESMARLIILGEGEDRSGLETLIRNLGLQESVELPGFVENPYQYMARSSALVLSSAWEGFGNVIVEAMACGTPVVSTDCPSGPAEILENGKYGLLVPVGDVDALGDAISFTLEKPLDSDVLRRRAAEFSLEKISNLYMEAMHVAN